ncbi:hypothetical protein JTE90_024731 [Oedothorax gibbosus]|uniref:Uncharacterized protein n=1 Tax=Oedothorax gibbosus TaxID=931172 RepID=A0AAV6UAU6_9ARAC|nr:hypothetical protein JTE90_024731 [Oedothorax gibbosus]
MDNLCGIGIFLQDECHRLIYTRTSLLHNNSELSEENKELLLWRSGTLESSIQTVCSHHKEVFLRRYETSQNLVCCNPFKSHKKGAKGSLRPVLLEFAKEIKLHTPELNVVPGQRLCTNCINKINHIIKTKTDTQKLESSDSKNSSDQKETVREIERQKLDSSFVEMGVSPMKMHSLPSHSKKVYGKRKLKEAKRSLATKVSRTLGLSEEDMCDSSDADKDEEILTFKQKAKDLDQIVELLKQKLPTVNRRKKIQLLTITPMSWSRDYAAETFGVTPYMIRQARMLTKEKGICELPPPKMADLEALRQKLNDRFELAKTITGTRSFHNFQPISMTTISCKRISTDESIALTFSFTDGPYTIAEQLKINSYVCCNYDSKWYIGVVKMIEAAEGDALVQFMHPNGPSRSFHWPNHDDECWIPFPHILQVIDMPSTETGRQYRLTEKCQAEIATKWLNFNK